MRAVAVIAAFDVQRKLGELVDGWDGRFAILGGYRWTPNWYFNEHAAAAGHPVTGPSSGAISGVASFGYSFGEFIEFAVDVYGGYEQFVLEGYSPFSSQAYGVALGARFTRGDFPFRGLIPYAGVAAGPTLAMVNSLSLPGTEKSILGLVVAGGFTYRLSDRLGLTFDVRWLWARVPVTGIAAANVGGVSFHIGFSIFFAATPEKKDLDVPGF